MNISDVLIHVNESLNEQQRSALEEAVRGIDGVIAPRFNPGKEHLLLVAFNPDRTNFSILLNKVQSFGYQAQLIGA
jgi:hypothetical protein